MIITKHYNTHTLSLSLSLITRAYTHTNTHIDMTDVKIETEVGERSYFLRQQVK